MSAKEEEEAGEEDEEEEAPLLLPAALATAAHACAANWLMRVLRPEPGGAAMRTAIGLRLAQSPLERFAL